MILKRAPRPALRPFVEAVWAIDEASERRSLPARREHVLPTGQMHLAVRLADDPLRLFDTPEDTTGHILSEAVVGGARAAFYVREVSKPLNSVGAQLLPGAAEALFGVTADELTGRHTPLEDLWGGPPVSSIQERLAERRSLDDRLDTFEAMLAAWLPPVRGLHPAVARALEQLRANANVHEAVSRSGYSHRTFISLFTRSVGLTPKVYSRLLRFQRVLRRATARPGAAWVDVAMVVGYSDQSHLVREFRELAGMTPAAYRRVAPRFAHHLPMASNAR